MNGQNISLKASIMIIHDTSVLNGEVEVDQSGGEKQERPAMPLEAHQHKRGSSSQSPTILLLDGKKNLCRSELK